MQCVHPLRIGLGRIARSAAILVCEARQLVIEWRPSHLPIWQLHSGSKEWLERIRHTAGWWGCDEYDVNDCNLNTPAMMCWTLRGFGSTSPHFDRRQPCFAIAKDGKKGDHRGRPAASVITGPLPASK